MTGKWARIDSHQVPTSYFQHFLVQVNAPINSVQLRPHKSQPHYRRATEKVSYKLYDPELFFAALEEQDLVSVKEEVVFCGDEENQEEEDINNNGTTAEEMIQIAKQKANISRRLRKRASSKSCLIVGYGKGRSTRELELIWWPNLYSVTKHGRLIIRFYVDKCDF